MLRQCAHHRSLLLLTRQLRLEERRSQGKREEALQEEEELEVGKEGKVQLISRVSQVASPLPG